jgi:hypothetical protein
MIPCPKCRFPGILYVIDSLHALIGSRHIAYVLHPATLRCPSRRVCRLTRIETDRIGPRPLRRPRRSRP